MLDDFMHFENIRAGKYLRRWPVSVRFLEFSAIGPSAEGPFVLPMGQYNIGVAFNRPQDFQSNKARHIFHQPDPPLETLLEVFLASFSDL